MARINDLLRQLERTDAGLAAEIQREYHAVAERRAFGLNFERHTPEAVELPGRPVRRGDKVHVLPPRGETPKKENHEMWSVESIDKSGEQPVATIVRESGNEDLDSRDVPLEDLVVVAEFRDPIYPGLVSTGKVERGGDKPFHSVINGENFHALEALLFTHRGKVDAIYIDPPYNTGTEHWKYNDRYVDTQDLYRHSKWLAFMEKRLLIAKELLAPEGLILASIDDREFARLKLLLDQIFSEGNFVSSFVWRTDGNLDNQAKIKSNHEYVLAYARDSEKLSISGVRDPNIEETSKLFSPEIRNSVVKNGPKNPISKISLPPGFPASAEDGVISAREDKWPRFSSDMVIQNRALSNAVTVESGWANANLLKSFISNGYAPVIDSKGQETSFEITQSGAIENVKKRREDQHHILTVLMNMGTVETAGNMLRTIGIDFPYPKPLPLLEYLLSFGPKSGIYLDFFAGSGTTAHAIFRLNALDGGRRSSILVTNNEVEPKIATEMTHSGLRRNDVEWQVKGICESVTKPRISMALEGKLDDLARSEVKNESERAGFDENVEFYTLTYESSLQVSAGRAFERIAPLLWLKAGSLGPRIESVPEGWAVSESYGVLTDLAKADMFIQAIAASSSVNHAFIVTEEDKLFEAVAQQLPAHVEPVRLYEAYLRNFERDALRVTR